MRALPYPCLCLVTDRALCGGSLVDKVAAAVSGGVDAVQLREKDMPAGELLETGAPPARRYPWTKLILLINDRLDAALAAGADGLHLPEASLSVQDAKGVTPSDLLVGKSVHGLPAASQAAAEGADYLILGYDISHSLQARSGYRRPLGFSQTVTSHVDAAGHRHRRN